MFHIHGDIFLLVQYMVYVFTNPYKLPIYPKMDGKRNLPRRRVLIDISRMKLYKSTATHHTTTSQGTYHTTPTQQKIATRHLPIRLKSPSRLPFLLNTEPKFVYWYSVSDTVTVLLAGLDPYLQIVIV